MRHDDQTETHPLHRRQVNRQRTLTLAVQKDSIRVLTNPTFCSPRLFSRFLNGLLKPSLPVALDVMRILELAMLVGENDDLLVEDHQEIANLFAVAATLRFALVPVHARIAPE